MPRQFSTIIREALACHAADDRLEDAIMREIRRAVICMIQDGMEAARESLGEEMWAYGERNMSGAKTILVAGLAIEDTDIPKRLRAHLREVWGRPKSSLVGTVKQGADPILDGEGVAHLFVQEWGQRGVPDLPIAEVRGLFIRKSEATDIMRKVLDSLIENGLMSPKENDSNEDALIRRQRLHRITLSRFERAQTVIHGKPWTSPLSPYCRMGGVGRPTRVSSILTSREFADED